MSLRASKWRRLLFPAITTAIMLALACMLGVWQVHRLAWKTALLSDIDRAEASPAIPLSADPPPFAKLRVEGKFLPGQYALYGADVGETQAGPQMGARLIAPFQPDAGGPPLLVDRGWVPAERAASFVPPDNPVAVEGYVRQPDRPGWFSARDNPAGHRFFTLDPAAIGPSLGLAQERPFVLVALGPRVAGVYPEPAQSLPRPPNDHLSYAITWFALALTLVAIFGLYSRKVLCA